MTATVSLLELRAEPLSRPGSVDREAGLVLGVKVLGLRSSNLVQGLPTRYSLEALRVAVPMYEGAPVYVDHPSRDTPLAPRSYADRIGRLVNVRAEPDGLYGDLRVNKGHELAEQLLNDAEQATPAVGLSHNAQGHGSPRGGDFVVERISSVRSVDVVPEPATTRSLFESASPAPVPLQERVDRLERELREAQASRAEAQQFLAATEERAPVCSRADFLAALKGEHRAPAPTPTTPLVEAIESLDAFLAAAGNTH